MIEIYNNKKNIKKKRQVIIILKILITIWFYCNGAYSAEMVCYPDDYIAQNKGKVIIEIPEVYELANIALAITSNGQKHPFWVYKDGAYYKRVLKHFLPFKNHPLINKIDFSDSQWRDYFDFRENSAAYVFKKNAIVSGKIYSRFFVKSKSALKHPSLFEEYRHLVEDFAKKSGFRQFYKQNIPYYKKQIATYRKKIPVKKMWSWLEHQFSARYDCYKIIFSPLIGGCHSTQRFEDKGFKEMVMFVSGPQRYRDKYSGVVEEGLLSRVVFTEIAHNYVNPVTDLYRRRLKKVFKDLGKWNKKKYYPDPYTTFNEYMTWAVFILYAYDNYKQEDFKIINRKVEKFMVKKRGFVLFPQFNQKLLSFYINRKRNEKISDLYPKILKWAEEYKY